MGLYDREYTQAGSQNGAGGGFSSQPMVVRIIIVTAIAFLIDNLLTVNSLNKLFHLEASVLYQPWKLWKLVTVGLTHAPLSVSVFHVLGNMYSLWLFGRAVEGKYGAREFLFLYIALLVGSSLTWCAFELMQGNNGATAVGASGAVTGVLVIFALSFPKQKFYLIPFPFPIQAWVLGLLIVGQDALGTLGMNANPLREGAEAARIAYTAHLGGALFGAIYYFSGYRLSGGRHAAGWKLPSFSKTKLRIHDPSRRTAELDRRADAILEKVHREGADAITAKERKILDEYSRRMRQKNQ